MDTQHQSDLSAELAGILGSSLLSSSVNTGMVTLEIAAADIRNACMLLRDEAGFEQLTDLCGMDYSDHGALPGGEPWQGERYGVVYHLISYQRNLRLRVRAQLPEDNVNIESVIDVWAGADWFEREAFDLYGIIFHGHPDLRRILTDYGFIGHPFRKDFPLSGQVEMHYDEAQGRVVYQPATVEPRILVPRTIRKDVFANSRPAEEDESAEAAQ